MKKIFTLTAMILLLTGLAAAPSPDPCTNYGISLEEVTPVSGGYKWTYKICQYNTPAISNWVLESCICSDYIDETDPVEACRNAGIISDYGSSQGTVTLIYGADPHTGITGFKFEGFDQNFECATFWIITRISASEDKNVGLKAGQLVCTNYEKVEGPAHETSAPEFSSLAIAIAILLTTPAFAYLMVKKKR
jgi:hypothetical protein